MAGICRALVVDDEEDMAYLVASTIRFADDGLEVAGVAHSAQEAVEQLAVSGADVVVLDYRMPGRDGLAAAADILALDPGMGIVMFSAEVADAALAEAARLGVADWLTKDQLRDLPDAIRRNCRHHT